MRLRVHVFPWEMGPGRASGEGKWGLAGVKCAASSDIPRRKAPTRLSSGSPGVSVGRTSEVPIRGEAQNIYIPAPNSPGLSVPPEDVNSQAPGASLQVGRVDPAVREQGSPTATQGLAIAVKARGSCCWHSGRHGLCLLHVTSSHLLSP